MLLKFCGLSTLTAISTVILLQEGVQAVTINSLVDTTSVSASPEEGRGRMLTKKGQNLAQIAQYRTSIMGGIKSGAASLAQSRSKAVPSGASMTEQVASSVESGGHAANLRAQKLGADTEAGAKKIADGIRQASKSVSDTMSSVMGSMSSWGSSMYSAAKSGASSAYNTARSVSNDIADKGKRLGTQAIDSAKSLGTSAYRTAKSVSD